MAETGPDDVASQAKESYAQGYRALKMNATEELHYIDSFKKVQAVSDRVAAIREALGYDMDIAVDFHGRVHKSMAKVLAKELDPYHLMFIEEPVLAENLEALRDIVNVTSTPIATGERMFSRWDFKRILTAGYVDIVQPDLSMQAVSPNVKRSPTWRKLSMWRWFPTALWGPLPLPPVCRSIPAAPTRLSRNKAWVSTTIKAGNCMNI